MSGLGSKDRKKGGGGDGGPGWILTYGDMVTLLLAFFVMLFAVSSVEQEKFDAFVSGLGDFGNPAANSVAAPSTGNLVQSNPPVSPLVPGPTGEGGKGEDDTKSIDENSFENLKERVEDAVAEANLEDLISVRGDPRGVAIVISTDDVLFARGSAVVTQDGEDIIAILAPILRAFPNQIQVEGHADNIPLDRGGYTNWNLSTDRAVAVVQELSDDFDIAPERLTASGFGEYRPLDPRDTEEARAKNRRVEIVVVRNFDDLAEEAERASNAADSADGDTGSDATEGDGSTTGGTTSGSDISDIGQDTAALPVIPGPTGPLDSG